MKKKKNLATSSARNFHFSHIMSFSFECAFSISIFSKHPPFSTDKKKKKKSYGSTDLGLVTKRAPKVNNYDGTNSKFVTPNDELAKWRIGINSWYLFVSTSGNISRFCSISRWISKTICNLRFFRAHSLERNLENDQDSFCKIQYNWW